MRSVPRTYAVLCVFVFLSLSAAAQKKYMLTFNVPVINVTRSATTDTIITIGYSAVLGKFKKAAGYSVVIKPRTDRADLPPYSLPDYEKPFSKISEEEDILNVVYLTLTHDTSTVQKEISLFLLVKKSGKFEPADSMETRYGMIRIIVQSPSKPKPAAVAAAGGAAAAPVAVAPTAAVAATEISGPLKDSCKINIAATDVFQREKEDKIYPLKLDATTLLGRYKNSDLTVEVTADDNASDISKKAYKLDFAKRTFKDLDTTAAKDNVGYLKIIKDSISGRPPSYLVLKTTVKKGDAVVTESKQTITIKGIAEDSLLSYHYLAYVGTNFDLVDGPRAKNLFFATNVFLPTSKKNTVGMYLSLYGNRTMSATDTVKGKYGPVLSASKRLSDTSYRTYRSTYDVTSARVSDNLGAYVSALFQFWKKGNNKIQLYYAPSLEFVWRRTSMTESYANGTVTDSSYHSGSPGPGDANFAPLPTTTSNYNEYVFNVGVLGFMVVHESSEISVRVHCNVGYASTFSPASSKVLTPGNSSQGYVRTGDVFFSGRAWITEPSTGLTLQAEITNTWNTPRPFYGVTLSKAINFKNLGKIFQPLVPKN